MYVSVASLYSLFFIFIITYLERIKFTIMTIVTLIISFIYVAPSIVVHIQNEGDFIYEGFKTSKIRSGNPEGVQINRWFIQEGCSVNEVLLYI